VDDIADRGEFDQQDRSGKDLEDIAAEVPPTDGTLVAFKRSDYSWHGHKPFASAGSYNSIG